MKKLDLKATRAILHDWGNLARSGDVGELLHGFPTRNTLHKQMKGGGGTDGLTPPELATDRLKGYQGLAIRADALLHEMPIIPHACAVLHYRDKIDTQGIADKLGTSTREVQAQRLWAENTVCTAINALMNMLQLETSL